MKKYQKLNLQQKKRSDISKKILIEFYDLIPLENRYGNININDSFNFLSKFFFEKLKQIKINERDAWLRKELGPYNIMILKHLYSKNGKKNVD